MQTKIPILAALTIMSTLFAIPLAANNAHAVPGLSVLDPSNTWSPYGSFPNLQHVVLKFYTGDAAEYAAFQAGGSNGLDIADDGTSGNGPPVSQWPIYDNTCGTCTPTSNGVDWNFTLVQGSANWQGMYFNGASSTWANWGCNWQFYNSACGVEMRQAFAHLVNRPDFVTANDGGIGGTPIWDDAPANKVLSTCFSPTTVPCDGTPPAPAVGCPSLPTIDNKACTFQSASSIFCSWDTISTLSATKAGCTSTTGPYLVGGTGLTNGFPTLPGAQVAGCPAATSPITNPAAWADCRNDFALAAAHMVRAGVATGIDASNGPSAYQLTGINAGIATHHLRACVRSTEPRRTMGQGWVNTLRLLLGSGGSQNANSVDLQFGNIIVCGFNKAFSEPPTSPIDDWDMYTYGYSAGGPFPDFLFTQFSTRFTFTPGGCGGTAAFTADFPTNPTFVCINGSGAAGNADTALLNAVSTTTDETTFDHKLALDSGSGLDILGKAVASIPVHTQNVRVPALRSVVGITNTKGLGFANVLIFNNAHKGPYSPVNSQFQFNNGGPADTIRWGQAQPISYLNPFQAGSVWEFNAIGDIFDTVLTANPVRPQEVYGEMAQNIVQGSVVCGTPPVTCTSFTVQLRQNLRFQDGTQVTAKDVAFSYLNFKDFASVISGNLGLLDHVTLSANNPLLLTIVMNGQSVGHLPNLAGVPVIPMARWQCPASGISIDGSTPCNPTLYNAGSTTIPQADMFRAGPGYDPLSDSNLIGSGLLACISDSGVVGTGCAKDSNGNPTGQAIDPGGSLRLTVFDLTASLGDPFAQFTRLNNPAWSPSSRSGQHQEFLYADKGNNNQVTISDLTSANLCFGKSAQGPTDATHCPDYNYWIHGGSGTISIQTAIVAAHYHDGGVTPWSWSAPGGDVGTAGILTNVIAYTAH